MGHGTVEDSSDPLDGLLAVGVALRRCDEPDHLEADGAGFEE